MIRRMSKWIAASAGLGLLLAGCSESGRDPSPVELVVTATSVSDTYDLALSQDQELADILVRAFRKNPEGTAGAFNDVRLTAYRVSYRRTDGGTLVPEPFVVSLGQLVTTDAAAQQLNNFRALEPTALNQAPFAALLPQNGGRDPETGRQIISMEIAVEVYGETLAGERVYDFAVFPVEFCHGCLVG